MEYKITEASDSLRIEAEAEGPAQARLMEELAHCAAGTCSCPSAQYDKLLSLRVVSGPGGVNIELVPRPGETLDKADIENCLRFTANKLAGRP